MDIHELNYLLARCELDWQIEEFEEKANWIVPDTVPRKITRLLFDDSKPREHIPIICNGDAMLAQDEPNQETE